MGGRVQMGDGTRQGAARAPRRRLRKALVVAAVVAAAVPALVVGGCVYSCAFVPSSPADLPQSVGERSEAVAAAPGDAGWRDTVGEAASASADGNPAVEVVEDFPDAGEALVVQPSGSPKCPAVRMVTYAREGGRYAATGLWGASVARPGERSSLIDPLYGYTTAEVVADALSACLTSGRPVAFGVSMDPAVRDLTVGGVAPTWVREVPCDGGDLLRLVLRGHGRAVPVLRRRGGPLGLHPPAGHRRPGSPRGRRGAVLGAIGSLMFAKGDADECYGISRDRGEDA